MFKKVKAFLARRLNESGALPAIMAGCILIAATAVLLAGFSVTLTRNAELNSVKTNVNYYANTCEAILETEVLKNIPVQFETVTKPNLKSRLSECNSSTVTMTFASEPTLYKPAGATEATSVKVVLNVNVNKGGFKVDNYTQIVKYLDYAKRSDYALTKTSYIESFDVNGNAVWVTPK